MKTFIVIFTVSIAIGTASLSFADSYERKDFNYRSYKPDTSIGFYTNKACAIVSGVNTHDDMLKASVKAVSKDATKLGIKVGMTGAEAMELLR